MTIPQSKLLAFIKGYIKQHGYSPTIEEMGNAIHRKAPTVHEHLKNLVKGGYLVRDGYRRGYVVKKI